MTRTIYVLTHETHGPIIITLDHGSAWICTPDSKIIEHTVEGAREFWKALVDINYRRDREMEADLRADDAACAAGECDHYTCTGGRSIDEWAEPEPTMWDYVSEAYGPTAVVR